VTTAVHAYSESARLQLFRAARHLDGGCECRKSLPREATPRVYTTVAFVGRDVYFMMSTLLNLYVVLMVFGIMEATKNY
jgi:hypothetical protein